MTPPSPPTDVWRPGTRPCPAAERPCDIPSGAGFARRMSHPPARRGIRTDPQADARPRSRPRERHHHGRATTAFVVGDVVEIGARVQPALPFGLRSSTRTTRWSPTSRPDSRSRPNASACARPTLPRWRTSDAARPPGSSVHRLDRLPPGWLPHLARRQSRLRPVRGPHRRTDVPCGGGGTVARAEGTITGRLVDDAPDGCGDPRPATRPGRRRALADAAGGRAAHAPGVRSRRAEEPDRVHLVASTPDRGRYGLGAGRTCSAGWRYAFRFRVRPPRDGHASLLESPPPAVFLKL
jgi:hypothetical protein